MEERVVKLDAQPALQMVIVDLEEITDSRGEELTDKELVQLEELNRLQT